MKEVKLTIDGKEVQLTDEQAKALKLELLLKMKSSNPFERVEKYTEYYCIKETGEVYDYCEGGGSFDNVLYAESNYFNDKAFAKQVALHQLLYRKLLKYSYDNKCGDEEWNGNNMHAYVIYNFARKDYDVRWTRDEKKQGTVYFKSTTWATAALNEVVMPFVKEHPEFVW